MADQAGINLTDLQCLSILDLTGPVSAGRLAELTGSPPAWSTGLSGPATPSVGATRTTAGG